MNKIILIFLIVNTFLLAQDKYEKEGYLRTPLMTAKGILFTDNYASKLYLENGNGPKEILAERGCGYYYTISPDGKLLGYKEISEDFSQSTVIYDLSAGTKIYLTKNIPLSGQVSFSVNGKFAFSRGQEIVVSDGTNEKVFTVQDYSNIVSISPNSNYIAYSDRHDEIFLLNTEDGSYNKISSQEGAYFQPVWSPDGNYLLYSSLDGRIFLYDMKLNLSNYLIDGFTPCWLSDSKGFIFTHRENPDLKLINSDIWFYDIEKRDKINLTNTPEIFETDASVDKNNNLIFTIINTQELYKAVFNTHYKSISGQHLVYKIDERVKPAFYYTEEPKSNIMLDVPYVNQVYDTPDWFNGHSACGSTTAIMLIAYYKILPPWETICSTPSYHINNYGMYVSEKYRFRFFEYTLPANDPNGKAAYGGFGFTWNGGSPHTKQGTYYANHGIPSVTKDNPPHSDITTDIIAEKPYSICNALTSSGHIVLGHGLGTSDRTIVTNDPYGDKNRGYWNWYGKNAKYDWPGFNNGYQNFNTVYWGISSTFIPPVQNDSIVEDLDFNRGFFLYNKPPASMFKYYESSYGYNSHCWWVYTLGSSAYDSSFATWTPTIKKNGVYEVSAYINTSTCTNALYKIYHKDGMTVVPVNQKQINKDWVTLGRFNFTAGTTGYVRLGDGTGILNEKIVFDAIKFVFVDSVYTSVDDKKTIADNYLLEQNYPNPFNPTTIINYELKTNNYVELKIYDMLGREVETLVNEIQPAGKYSVEWNASRYSGGVYYYELTAGNFRSVKKMVLVK